MDFDYKKYSLENLEKWMSDALLSSEATPQEIYDVIKKVVEEEYYYFKEQTSRCYELLALLNGNGKGHLSCDKDDSSEECKKSWTSFWEDSMPPWGHSDMEALSNYYPHPDQPVYTEEELNAMCEKAASDEEKDKCREYNLREAEYYDKRAQLDIQQDDVFNNVFNSRRESKSKKWILNTSVDGLTGDVIVNLPDDLLEAANLKEGDQIEWIDNGEGCYIMKKVTQPIKTEN